MGTLDKANSQISNTSVEWAKLYDFYETELRDIYKNITKPNNDSHFEMLKSKGRKYFNKDNVFCEIGFGAGLTLRHALEHFGQVYGLDISSKNVELTTAELKNEGYNNFELYTSDLMVFDPRFENKFDIISFIHGLEHFTYEDYPVILNHIRKYLKPAGIFSGALPYNKEFIFRMCPNCQHIFEIDGHVSRHDLDSLRKVFLDNGFEIIHLGNFNLRYALSKESILKALYKLVNYHLFKQPSKNQIEYIVKVA